MKSVVQLLVSHHCDTLVWITVLWTTDEQDGNVRESGTKGHGNTALLLQLFQKSKLVSKYKVNKAL